MPQILHGIWHPGSETIEPALFLWAEVDGTGARGPKGQPGRTHPEAASPKELRTLLGRYSGGILYECAEPGQLAIQLPTWRGRPLPTDAATIQNAKLTPWVVPGLFVPPADVVPFLSGLPREGPPALRFGDTVRYWIEVADFCLGLIARQRLVPVLTAVSSGGLRSWAALWRPVLTDPEDRTAIETLAEAMPWICRVAGAGSDGGRPLAAHPLLVARSFLDTVLDAGVRPVLAEEGFPERPLRRTEASRIPGGPLGAWLRALGWIENEVEGEPRALAAFAGEVRRWSETLEEPAPGSFRTTFQLRAPEAPEADPAWSLDFFLQDRKDPAVLVPIAKVWEEKGAQLSWAGRIFDRPQDRLLEDLGRASRLFPPLDRALETAGPTSCRLTPEEAHSFLRVAAPLLDESGFGVITPGWWAEEATRPKLRLRLRPGASLAGDTSAPAAGLGTHAIIGYDWEVAIGDSVLSPTEFAELADRHRPLLHLHGRWVEVDPARTAAIHELIRSLPAGGSLSLPEAVRWSAGGPDSLADGDAPEVVAEDWIGGLLDQLRRHEAMREVEMDARFHGVLRPYQERGVAWLEFLRRCGLGACLADDMGLGKTVQLIALLLHERRLAAMDPPAGGATAPAVGPTLVLCPMSVVGNWQREIERFAPDLRVLVHHGLRRRRDLLFSSEAADQDVVITTYALAHRDRVLLRSVDWERIVLDEAQNLKNPGTLQSRAVRSLRARTRVALTGTPLENRLSELWSILETLNPGYLGSRADFRHNFAVPIERNRDPKRRETLRRLVQPFLLRRMKTDPEVIRDLPEKLEMDVFCNLTREQAAIYQAVVDEMMGAIERAEGITRRGLVLATLTRLKQVCNHPAHYLRDGSAIEGRSGKVARLGEMLEEVLAVGERALVFTQFAEMGRLLEGYLAARLRRDVLFLHGGVPKGERDRQVERFSAPDGPPIFLLSLRAGGLGLNLTPANHVFHFDRWWNPAVEDQATDRAFRIGQTRNVQVHKFVCVGTLEERIDRMIREKRELADLVVGSGEQWLTELDTRQLREVLLLSRDAVSED